MGRKILALALFAAGLALIGSPAASQPPGKDGKGKDGKGEPPRYELGQVFPPPLVSELKLTPEQEKELDAILADAVERGLCSSEDKDRIAGENKVAAIPAAVVERIREVLPLLPPDTRLCGPIQDRVEVLLETLVREVGADVDQVHESSVSHRVSTSPSGWSQDTTKR